GDAAIEIFDAVLALFGLLALDRQHVAVGLDRNLVFREAGDRHGDAISVLAGALDIVGRIARRTVGRRELVKHAEQPVEADGRTIERGKIDVTHDSVLLQKQQGCVLNGVEASKALPCGRRSRHRQPLHGMWVRPPTGSRPRRCTQDEPPLRPAFSRFVLAWSRRWDWRHRTPPARLGTGCNVPSSRTRNGGRSASDAGRPPASCRRFAFFPRSFNEALLCEGTQAGCRRSSLQPRAIRCRTGWWPGASPCATERASATRASPPGRARSRARSSSFRGAMSRSRSISRRCAISPHAAWAAWCSTCAARAAPTVC